MWREIDRERERKEKKAGQAVQIGSSAASFPSNGFQNPATASGQFFLSARDFPSSEAKGSP